MDPLLRQLGEQCKVCAYADDLLILVEAQSRSAMEQLGTRMLTHVAAWGEHVGVEVARDKSVTMLLKGKLSANRHPSVKLGEVGLSYCTQVKYLGITMGERMTFTPHLVRLREKLAGVAGHVRRVLRTDWGLSRRAVRTMYSGLFLACASYGAPVWYRTVLKSEGYAKVLSCQRVVLLACLPVCRTVSTEALQVLMGAAPLDLEVIRSALSFKLKRGMRLLPCDWSIAGVESMSAADRKLCLRECVMSRWQTRWNTSRNGRVTFRFISDVTFVGSNPDFGFGLFLGFLLTGHGSLNAFLHKRTLSASASCSCGAPVEDSLHVLCDCPLYDDIRNLDVMGIVSVNGQWDVSGVLSTSVSFGALGAFARRLFSRRRVIVR